MIGDGLPPAQLGHGVVGHPHAGQLLEGRDRRVVELAAPEESEEAEMIQASLESPASPRLTIAAGSTPISKPAQMVSRSSMAACAIGPVGASGGGRELVSEVVPQDAALSRVQLGSILARLNRRGPGLRRLNRRRVSRRCLSLRRPNRGRLSLRCLDRRSLSCRRGRRGEAVASVSVPEQAAATNASPTSRAQVRKFTPPR